jgi:hypothetical protein
MFHEADGTVTVLGPDGPTIIDLGDGEASVTISRDADTGDLTITTEGTASELDLGDVLGELPGLDGHLDQMMPFEPLDPERLQSCLDELGTSGTDDAG